MNLLKIGRKQKNQIPETYFEDFINDKLQDNEFDFDDYIKQYDKENKTITNDLKQYKKTIDKYCFTISFGCMLKISLLLIFSTLLTIFKVWLYITYC